MTPPPPSVSTTAVDDGHQLARGAVANLIVLLAANFRGIFILLIARLLGQTALGAFGLMFTVTDLLSKPSTLGLEEGMVPLVARRRALGDGEGARHIFRGGLLASLATSVVVAGAAALALQALARINLFSGFPPGTSVMLFALPGIALARLSSAASRGMLVMTNEFYARGVADTMVTIAAFVAAIAFGFRDTAPAIAVVVGSTAGGIVGFVLARRGLRLLQGASAEGRVSTREGIQYALPIAGSGLLNVLVINLDVLILGAYVGRAPGVTAASFGAFCAAAEIAGGMRKVRQVFDPIFAPVAATRDVSSDPGALRHTLEGPGRWVLAAQLPLIGLLLLASGLVLSIYGSGFREAAVWLALLGLAHGMSSFAGLVETLFYVKRPTLNVVNAVVTIIVQAIVSLLLIPRMGVTGAALGMLAGFASQAVLRFIEMRHVFGWSWPWHSLTRPVVAFVAAIVPGALIRLFVPGPWGEAASATLFVLLYAAAWSRMGADPADREIWRRLRARKAIDAVPDAQPVAS